MTPFEPLTLRREMEIFGEDLGIPLNEPTLPDVEFLACLATGYSRDSALQQNELGCRFRNFYNFIRVTIRSSPTTLRRLTEYLGISETELRELARGRPDGPLVPQLLDAFGFFEGVTLRLVENRPQTARRIRRMVTPGRCPMLMWFGHGACAASGHAERRFVERLVSLASGLLLVQSCIANPGSDSTPIPSCYRPVSKWPTSFWALADTRTAALLLCMT